MKIKLKIIYVIYTKFQPSRSRKSTSETSSTNDDQAYQIIKHVQELMKKIVGFETKFQQCKEFVGTYLGDFEDKINYKKRKVAEMDEDYKLQQKQKEIELRNHINEQGYQFAVEILASRTPKEIPVQETMLNSLREQIKQLQGDMKKQISDEVAKHKELLEKEYKHREETSRLQQESQSASMKAQADALNHHIDVLKESLASAKEEINKQRELTKEISTSFSNASKTTLVSNDGFSSSATARR